MKNNKLLLGTAIFAGAFIFSAQLYFNNSSQYTPRTSEQQGFEDVNGALGAQKWLFDIQKNPLTGKVDEADVLKAREEAFQFYRNNGGRAPIGLEWTELGPDNVGGRTRGILVDKNNPQKLYAVSVAGGLFISTNGGSTWKAHNDQLSMLNMSCITQAANGDIYIGTGEDLYNGFGSGDGPGGLLGGGIYKSSDGGVTFALLPSTIPGSPNSVSNTTGNEFIGVNNIAADPTNPNRIYAATRSGLQMTDDGGATWNYAATLANNTPIKTRTTDVDVASDGTVIASIGNKLYISPNGAVGSFSNTGVTGLPNTGLVRIEFAIAPSDPNYMYALAGKSSNGLLEGVYQSVDKGLNWTKIGNGGSSQFEVFGTGQAGYDNTIEVFPSDKGRIIIGGVSMWAWQQTSSSTPGIGQWKVAASQNQSPFNPFYVHADVHTIKFHPTNPSVFYIGCDGGVFRGKDSIINNQSNLFYQPMNNGFNVTQFYSIAYQGNGVKGTGIMGGTQDNGTHYISGNGNTTLTSVAVGGGDGGECEISYLNPNASFSTVYYGSLSRRSTLTGAGASFYNSRISKLTGFGTAAFASFVTPVSFFETKTATNSPDSITFINDQQTQVAGVADGASKKYLATLSLPYWSATVVPGSITITCGSQTITDDGAGLLVGDIDATGTNTVNYSTKLMDFTFATVPPGGTSIDISFDVMYNAGSNLTFNRPQYASPLNITTTSVINPGDTVKFMDPFQAKFAVGFAGTNGVWMTKEALDFGKTPEWIKVGTVTGTTEVLKWSEDGDILYVGTSSGSLFRFSNMNAVVDSANADLTLDTNSVIVKTQIASFAARSITDISVDPVNKGKIAVVLGNYGQSSYVYYASNADVCAQSFNTSNFTLKQGTGTTKLPSMPVYSVIIEKTNPNHVIVGTEYGIYSTDDISQANPTWSVEMGNTGKFPNVITLALRQQRRDGDVVNNPNVIYAGTHGRGAWKSSTLIGPVTVGINDPAINNKVDFQTSLSFYPNPMNDIATVAFELAEQTAISVSIFNLQGKLVKTINKGKLAKGNQKVVITSDGLSKGTYLISVDGTNVHATTRFIVVK